MFVPEVTEALKKICLDIGACYELIFVEIGSDEDHVHFLIQSIPSHAPTAIAKIVKSITAKKLLAQFPWIKQLTLGSSLWTSGYYISTVGAHGNETVIGNYVKQQGKKYDQHYHTQPGLFDGYE